MKVEILSADEVIGVGELQHLDPPMGVAFGPFAPTTAYKRTLHAALIEGNENNLALSANLTVRGPDGAIECAGVGIQDAVGEIEVSVFGISDFETYFGDHPDYKGYYGPT
jgi:hypothetical protein